MLDCTLDTNISACIADKSVLDALRANIEFRVPYAQWYLFTAISDINHNANPTNHNCNGKGNLNQTRPSQPFILSGSINE